MKHLYAIVLFLVCASSNAQNWQAVYSDRVQYFDSGINAIKIISKTVDTNGDSVFFNYPSLYLNKNFTAVDWATDSTSWIGKALIIKPDGINGFIHTLNDTCIINTLAGADDTWSFIENDSVLITAHIDSLGFNTHNDITDSVKYISLKIVKLPANSWADFFIFLQGKQVWLSKHNGLLRFPVLEYNLLNYFYYQLSLQPQYNQTKVNLFTNKNMFDFELGDIIQTNEYSNYLYTGYPANGWSNRWVIDTYINKENDSIADSVQFTIQRRDFFILNQKNPDTTIIKSDTSYLFYQTYYNLNGQAFGVMPYSLSPSIIKNYSWITGGDKNHTEFIINTPSATGRCPFKLTIHQHKDFSESNFSIDYVSRIGHSFMYLDGSNGPPQYTINNSVLYAKNACGEYGKDITQSTPQISPLYFTIYPNPAKNTVSINANGIQTIKLFDISGKQAVVKFILNENEAIADVSTLADGIYFVVTETLQGKSTHKLIVNH